MTEEVWSRRLRVETYTGFGAPVEPDVKATKPGALRKECLPASPAAAGRASGIGPGRRPMGPDELGRARCAGGRNTGVPTGTGGPLCDVLGSGDRRIMGNGRLDNAKNRARASGSFARIMATDPCQPERAIRRKSSQPPASPA